MIQTYQSLYHFHIIAAAAIRASGGRRSVVRVGVVVVVVVVVVLHTRCTHMVRIAGTGDGASPADWYNSLPVVSRAFGTACVAATVLSGVGVLSPRSIYLAWELIIQKFHIWRLLGNFVYIGSFSFNFFIYVMMMYVPACAFVRECVCERAFFMEERVLGGDARLKPLSVPVGVWREKMMVHRVWWRLRLTEEARRCWMLLIFQSMT